MLHTPSTGTLLRDLVSPYLPGHKRRERKKIEKIATSMAAGFWPSAEGAEAVNVHVTKEAKDYLLACERSGKTPLVTRR